MKAQGVFHFRFNDESTDTITNKAFLYDTNTFYEIFEDCDDAWCEFVEDIEDKFGVHDCSTWYSDEYKTEGFTTYEVSPNQYDLLMQTWKDALENEGISCSNIVDYDETNVKTAEDLYNTVTNLLKSS